MDNIRIKEVTEADYDDVINIRTVYEGRDYLPWLYKSLLKRDKGIVALLGDKMVGFNILHVVDNGLTMIPRAGRVSKEFEEQGVYKKLDQYVTEYCKERGIIYKAVSFNNTNSAMMRKVHDGIYRSTLYRKLQIFRNSMDNIRSDVSRRSIEHELMSLDEDHLAEILGNKEITKCLFTGDVFASCWVPLRVMGENAEHVLAEFGVVFGSALTEPGEAMISIGHPMVTGVGLSYNIDFYGLHQGQAHARDHIIKHLQTLIEYKQDFIQLEIFADEADIDCVTNVVTELGFTIHVFFEKEMHCAERSISG